MSAPNKKRRRQPTNLTLQPDLLTLGKRLAEKQRRSFSNLVEVLLAKELGEAGFFPKAA